MDRTSVFCRISVLLAIVAVGLIGCQSDPPDYTYTTVTGPNATLDPAQRPDVPPGGTNDDKLSGQGQASVMDKVAASLLTTDLNTITATDVVDALVGAGPNAPTVSNITYSGANHAAGTFSGGTGIVGFENGIILGSGNIASVPGPNVADNITTNNGLPGDADLDGLIPGYSTNDATILEFDFECEYLQVISFTYVFTSDEYNEYVNSAYNDVFGFFVNGVNIALLPDMVTPVSINNVNCGNPYAPPGGTNCSEYINNDISDGGGAVDTEMDGLTVVLTATATINPGLNHIKLAIADAGDHVLDSNVFIQGESFLCVPPPSPGNLDIKPTSCPSAVNVGNQGLTPAAIVGAPDLDVHDIDVSTVLLEGIPPVKWGYEDVVASFDGELCNCTEEGPDGIMDLALKFETQMLAEVIPLGNGAPVLTITGYLLDGTPFSLSDCIKVVGVKFLEE
jgi:hypothetical protein